MTLVTLQRAIARAVMQPLTSSERMRRSAPDGGAMSAYAARFIKPNDRLTSFERLEIYNRQYWFRLLSSMVEDFPGLRAVVGSKRFESMSTAYLTECPSRSFTLRNLGAGLERWLRKHPHWRVALATGQIAPVRFWSDVTRAAGWPRVLRRLSGADGTPAPTWTPERLFGLFPNLAERQDGLGGQMSGGEQQMLTVSRTLMGNPYLVLLDEPSEGVAPVIVEQMANMILELKREGLSILLSEQNLHFAELVSDRAYVLEKGQIRFSGTIGELAKNETVRRAYLSV